MSVDNLLSQILGEPRAAIKRAAQREAQATLNQKMADARYYWEGNDNDANLVRLVLGGLETIMASTLTEKPASRLVVAAITPTLEAAMSTVDKLIDIGVIRCMALGKPVRGEPGFEETVPPTGMAPADPDVQTPRTGDNGS